MAFDPRSALMPKHHSIRHKASRLAFCGSKRIKANPLALAVRPSKARTAFVNRDWGDIALTEQYLLHGYCGL
jgi:hypothetical protein